MENTMESQDIHVLIQGRDYDFYGFISDHRDAIEEHIAMCSSCEERFFGWACHLPKFRARKTVIPEGWDANQSYRSRVQALEKLGRGECLPCGCQVTDVPWTREQTAEKLYRKLAEVMEITEEEAKRVPETIRCLDLPLSAKQLRRLRDEFWLPDGSLGSEEGRDAEEGETVRQLPATVGEFIDQIKRMHCGISYTECSEHWNP